MSAAANWLADFVLGWTFFIAMGIAVIWIISGMIARAGYGVTHTLNGFGWQ